MYSKIKFHSVEHDFLPRINCNSKSLPQSFKLANVRIYLSCLEGGTLIHSFFFPVQGGARARARPLCYRRGAAARYVTERTAGEYVT